jgi:hypothetical protein
MKLILHRKYLKNDYTIGNLYLKDEYGNQKFICNVLEDKVRDLNKNGRFDNGEKKVQDKTAIPYGEYKVAMDIISPKYSNSSRYPKYAKYGGMLPRLLGVSEYSGVLFHIGNTHQDSSGCLLVGENKAVGKVLNSTKCFYDLMDNYLLPAHKRGEEIWISIV